MYRAGGAVVTIQGIDQTIYIRKKDVVCFLIMTKL